MDAWSPDVTTRWLSGALGLGDGRLRQAVVRALHRAFTNWEEAQEWLSPRRHTGVVSLLEELSKLRAAQLSHEHLHGRRAVGLVEVTESPRFCELEAELLRRNIPVSRVHMDLIDVPSNASHPICLDLWAGRYLSELCVLVCASNVLYEFPRDAYRLHVPHVLTLHKWEQNVVSMWWPQFAQYTHFLLADLVSIRDTREGRAEIERAMGHLKDAVSPSIGPLGFRDHDRAAIGIHAVGYPSLDRVMLEVVRTREERAILYAPIGTTTGGTLGLASVKTHGLAIVRELLARFPYHRVVFRPYLTDRASDEVRAITSAFAGSERFELDISATPEVSMARCELLVSDTSRIKFTYAYGALRPAIAFQAVPMEQSADVFRVRQVSFGYVAYSIDQVVEAVGLALADRDGWAARLRLLRDNECAHPGGAIGAIADVIEASFWERPSRGEKRISLPEACTPTVDQVLEALRYFESRSYLWEYYLARAVRMASLYPDDREVQQSLGRLLTREGLEPGRHLVEDCAR